MTCVIAQEGTRAYPAVMTGHYGPDTLSRLLAIQQALEARTTAVEQAPASVLEVGKAVLDFASSEEEAFFPILPLLDPAVRSELGDEHEQLAEDLQLLEWLVSTTPDSPDVGTLSDALARRMHAHVARDGRLLAHALRLSERVGRTGSQ
jgi:hypothetical protein